jgi:FkbM family methyltransferase
MLSDRDYKQIPLWHRLPLTRFKLLGARIIYGVVRPLLGRNDRSIRRKGINYRVDLSEGIDLALFLFGNFQKHVTSAKHFRLPPDATVFDVGANFGVMALMFAKACPRGRVYAFEPTMYAYRRLLVNLSANPKLSERIVPVQAFLSDQTDASQSPVAYSSWKVDGKTPGAHPVHGGSRQSVEGAGIMTIDNFCEQRQIHRVDLIKIDTDGHEFQVLWGASKTLSNARPHIVFEAGLYTMEEKGITFDRYFDYLASFGYRLLNTKNGREVSPRNYLKEIPLRSTTDILAVPGPPGNK